MRICGVIADRITNGKNNVSGRKIGAHKRLKLEFGGIRIPAARKNDDRRTRRCAVAFRVRHIASDAGLFAVGIDRSAVKRRFRQRRKSPLRNTFSRKRTDHGTQRAT